MQPLPHPCRGLRDSGLALLALQARLSQSELSCSSRLLLGTCGFPSMGMGLWWVQVGTEGMLEGRDVALLWGLLFGGGAGAEE